MKKSGNLILFVLFSIFASNCRKEAIEIPPALDSLVFTNLGSTQLEIADYYISPDGDDENPGTIDLPFKSWAKGWSVAQPGNLIYVMGGIYRVNGNLGNSGIELVGKNGRAGEPIRFWAYPGDTPLLDLGDKVASDFHQALSFTGNYCHLKGLEIRNCPQKSTSGTSGYSSYGFVARNSNYCIFEGFNVHHNQGIGIFLLGNSTNNLIFNCDSHHNYDPYTILDGQLQPGNNADGIRLGDIPAGNNNIVRGCRSWANSDDGYDFWLNEGIVNVFDCWSFGNGYEPGSRIKRGDGTGFKLGVLLGSRAFYFKRIIKRCIAYDNSAIGFSQNRANACILFEGCKAFKNGSLGFHVLNFALPHYLKDNIALENNLIIHADYEVAVNPESVSKHNSWNGYTLSTDDFISTDPTNIDGFRAPDGAIVISDFLKLKAASKF